MQHRSRFLALASAIVAAVSANTFSDPHALALERRRTLEKFYNPAPIHRLVALRHKAFRAGARAHLKTARHDYFADLRELGGTPATRSQSAVPPVMNRAARRSAARALRYSS